MKPISRRSLIAGAGASIIIPKGSLARGIKGTGVGAAPQAPSWAGAVGFVNPTFNFTSADFYLIDRLNSKGPGYKFWVNRTWTGVAGSPDARWNSTINNNPAPASSITLSGSKVVLTPDASLNSACPNGAGGYFGKAFGGGWASELVADFVPAGGTTTGWWTNWTVCMQFLLGTAVRFTEIDAAENFPGGTSMQGAVHEWDVSVTPTNSDTFTSTAYPTPDSSVHTYGFYHRTMAQNNGTGEFKWFYDGVLQKTVTYTTGALYSVGDNQTSMIKIVAGAPDSPTLNLTRYTIWQRPGVVV